MTNCVEKETVTFRWTDYVEFDGSKSSVLSSWPCIPVTRLNDSLAMVEEFGFVELQKEYSQTISCEVGDLAPGDRGLLLLKSNGIERGHLITVSGHRDIEQDKYDDYSRLTDEDFE